MGSNLLRFAKAEVWIHNYLSTLFCLQKDLRCWLWLSINKLSLTSRSGTSPKKWTRLKFQLHNFLGAWYHGYKYNFFFIQIDSSMSISLLEQLRWIFCLPPKFCEINLKNLRKDANVGRFFFFFNNIQCSHSHRPWHCWHVPRKKQYTLGSGLYLRIWGVQIWILKTHRITAGKLRCYVSIP